MAQVAHVARATLYSTNISGRAPVHRITADMNTFAPWPVFTSTSLFANKLVTTAISISAHR